jgi:hypothetical protein
MDKVIQVGRVIVRSGRWVDGRIAHKGDNPTRNRPSFDLLLFKAAGVENRALFPASPPSKSAPLPFSSLSV